MRQASRIGGGLGFVDADEHPAGRPINRHKQVAAGRFVSHLRQILDVHVQIAGLIGLERLVLRSGAFRLQIAQIANPMPPQAAVQPRARDLRVEKLPQRAIEGAIGSSPIGKLGVGMSLLVFSNGWFDSCHQRKALVSCRLVSCQTVFKSCPRNQNIFGYQRFKSRAFRSAFVIPKTCQRCVNV